MKSASIPKGKLPISHTLLQMSIICGNPLYGKWAFFNQLLGGQRQKQAKVHENWGSSPNLMKNIGQIAMASLGRIFTKLVSIIFVQTWQITLNSFIKLKVRYTGKSQKPCELHLLMSGKTGALSLQIKGALHNGHLLMTSGESQEGFPQVAQNFLFD